MPSSNMQTTFNTTDNDRRHRGHDRRKGTDRRSYHERRRDLRLEDSAAQKITLKNRIRQIVNPRLGVDRRKSDQRSNIDRRNQNPSSLLSQEELAALLEEK